MQGYPVEEHIVHLKDGQILGIHRIPHGKTVSSHLHPEQEGTKPVVFLQHGFMMTSEVWVCNLDASRQLPFLLADSGYDVWLGNTRGNKYSMKHMRHTPDKRDFWEFSIDELAIYDLPGATDYVLGVTGATTISYIGFSQGTAQAFAALAINPDFASKVHLFIALAPAMAPSGLYNPIVDAFIRASPQLIYLFFGRKALLTLTLFWQRILYPTIFVKTIDACLSFLFGWNSRNMTEDQKQVSYYHLYSFTSVKCVVHWFQIIRARAFQMYDDHSISPSDNGSEHYRNPRFPTTQIKTPLAILYGGSDSLVDINVLLSQLPTPVFVKKVPAYEHLDFLWADSIDETVYPDVFRLLSKYELGSMTKHAEKVGVPVVPNPKSLTEELTQAEHLERLEDGASFTDEELEQLVEDDEVPTLCKVDDSVPLKSGEKH